MSSYGASKTLRSREKNGDISNVCESLGFRLSSPSKDGTWQGIDVDFCRSIAAAIFGDTKKVKYIPLSSKERFTALQSGRSMSFPAIPLGQYPEIPAWESILLASLL